MKPLIIFALTAMSLVAGCVSPEGSMVSKQPVKLTVKQQNEAKAAVTYSLIDPESAMFRNVRGRNITFTSGNPVVQVCGEVNSKNRMGGFAGFSTFHGEYDASGKFTLRNIDGIRGGYSIYACQ